MKQREIYLDNNATTRPLPEVREAVIRVMGKDFGNPSSAHHTGERARQYLAKARQQIADILKVDFPDIVFTSSGTEANNMVFRSCVSGRASTCRVVTTTVEHSSVLKMCEYLSAQGTDVAIVPVDPSGLVDIQALSGSMPRRCSRSSSEKRLVITCVFP